MLTESEVIQKPYNSRLIDVYIRMIKHRYPQIDIHELLRSADMEYYQVADQGLPISRLGDPRAAPG